MGADDAAGAAGAADRGVGAVEIGLTLLSFFGLSLSPNNEVNNDARMGIGICGCRRREQNNG